MSQTSFIDNVSAELLALQPYQAGKTAKQIGADVGIEDAIKLSSNENPLGTGQAARQTLQQYLETGLQLYPDATAVNLRSKIAQQLGVSADNIVCGNGSNDLLDLCAKLVLYPGKSAIYSQYSFVCYRYAAIHYRATAVEVAADGFGHDLALMATAAQQPDAGIVFIGNPNNPTGSWHPPEAIRDFIKQVPKSVLIVLDEAYHEYVFDGPGATIAWINEFDNLVITRTFSKIHGLAALRIGYAIANQKICSLLNRVRQPFNANALAQDAAIAALGDQQHITKSQQNNRDGMVQLQAGFTSLGYVTIPSQGNFICFAAKDANAVNDQLLKAGLIVRMLAEYGLSNWLRTTIGLPSQNEKLLTSLPKLQK